MMNTIIAAVDKAPSIASVVITGFVIIFVMLLFLVLLFGSFGKIMSAITNTHKDKKPSAPKKTESTAKPIAKSAHVSTDDDELIAVISAAVYAMYEGSGKQPIIRSVRPAVRNGKSAWAMAGVYNNIKSF